MGNFEKMDKRKDSEDEGSNPERGNWGGSCEVVLSYVGYCVGLGNIWRFPYLCYRNGGGAFLIPYFLVLVLAGCPIYFLEVALGQYSSSSASTVWKFCPLFKGVGYCMVLLCAFCSLYYNMLVAYILRFLVASMTSQLPWATCDNEWNTELCRTMDYKEHAANVSDLAVNASSVQLSTSSNTYDVAANASAGLLTALAKTHYKSPAEEYWERRLLQVSSGIDDLGSIQWELALSLFAAWLLVFFCLIKGIQSTGKVVYVTATFPFIVMIILLIRGATLPGALKGILYFIVPDFSKLANTKVWGDAASQIFYSLGQSWGILITYGSYNKFNHNSARDTLISCIFCPLASLLSGFIVFSIIGFLSHELDAEISEVMTSGPGLVFVVYPEALARMPIAPMWSILFFLMMLTVAIDSMFATFETVLSAFVDEFPEYLMKRKTLFTAVCSAIMFLCALPLTTKGGIYVLTLIDWYSGTFPPLTVAIFEVIVVAHVYGWRRFSKDIELMMGFKPNYYWIVCWVAITPVMVVGITLFNAVVFTPVRYGDYMYPAWAEALGWLTALASILCIPGFMIGLSYKQAGSLKNLLSAPIDTVRALLKPQPEWTPKHLRAEKPTEMSLMEKNVNVLSI